MAPADGAPLRVQVTWAPRAREVQQVSLTLPAGSTVADALQASGLGAGAAAVGDLALAVWGRVVPGSTPLRDHDRVELLRPLQVDPKEARRLRYRSQAECSPRRRGPATR
jgi:putative ubiquitin-RnfH superfamily antitoxin RatB of RatAB toxin-antitoxin module